jgi:hypothetical protein
MVKEVKWTFFLHAAYWSEHKSIYHYLYRHRHAGGQNTFGGPEAAHKLLGLSGRVRGYDPMPLLISCCLLKWIKADLYARYFFLAKHVNLDLFLKGRMLYWYRGTTLTIGLSLSSVQESANKGMILMRVLLDARLDYSMADMWVRSLVNLWLSVSSIWYI